MIHVIIGAPCAGKSTYVREHANDGDLRIDYDAIAMTLGAASHGSDGIIREAALSARKAAIAIALDNPDAETWVIHTSPTDWQRERYEEAGAEFITLDTDMETCLRRVEEDGRPEGTADVIREWFNNQKGGTMPQYKDARDAAIADGGSVKGYASTWDRDPDSYGDVIAKGAFAKSLERWAKLGMPIPLLYGHNTDDPEYNIGAVTLAKEDERGLYIEADFDAENPKAQYVRKLVREGRLFQFSFAFDCTDWADVKLEDGTKARELRELDIYEVSLVQIPANQHAEVVEVKAGRRNSMKDEGDLRRLRDLLDEADEIIDRLIDEPVEQPTEEPTEANEDEQDANSEEPKDANVQALIDEANIILKKKGE